MKSHHLKILFAKARALSSELGDFLTEFYGYLYKNFHLSFLRFEAGKSLMATALYRQRGKYVRKFMHSGMAGLTAVGVMIAPVVAQEFPGRSVNPWEVPTTTSVLSATTELQTTTEISQKPRDKVLEYTVQEGDTISTIAQKFGVSEETILWQNDLDSKAKIKVGQTLEILPVAGILHTVQKGDTIYSIAKKYDASEQAIVDFDYNTFVNDETFELAVGQTIIVPDGIKPAPKQPSAAPRQRQLTPDAGTVVASGSFVWPTSGQITQNFSWYHSALDIANKAAPDVLAADGGTVVTSGWSNAGYGYYVVIDHGNGYRTLYAHMQKLYVVQGQTVGRGAAIGKMGSTGRSTGVHTHFEVYLNGVRLNPLNVLR